MIAPSIYQPSKRSAYQKLPQDDAFFSRGVELSTDNKPVHTLTKQPLTLPTTSSYLSSITKSVQLSKNQQKELRTHLQRALDHVLDPYSNSKPYGSMLFCHYTLHEALQDRGIEVYRGDTNGIHYENSMFVDAYSHPESHLLKITDPLLELYLSEAKAIIKRSDLSTVKDLKSVWTQISRLYLLHPGSEHKVFHANKSIPCYGQNPESDFPIAAHKIFLAKSVEISRQGIISLQKLKSTVVDHRLRYEIDESIADLFMQEAQGCHAHQPVETKRDEYHRGGSHNTAGARLQEAGKIYSNLVGQCDHKNDARIREKLANTFVLLACTHYERTTTESAPSIDSWSSQIEKKLQEPIRASVAKADIYEPPYYQAKSRNYWPSFSEQCFREAAFQLKTVIDQNQGIVIAPNDWLRIHCKYASAMIKQSLQMPFYHERNNEVRPKIDSEIRAIKKYLLNNRRLISPQDQVRTLIAIADLVYSEAKQRPRRDPTQCWPTKLARKIMRQRGALTIANRAYRLMKKHGGEEVMPVEAHFLKRRSSLSPSYNAEFHKTPYAATAAALYGFTDQWSVKTHLREANSVIGISVMLT